MKLVASESDINVFSFYLLSVHISSYGVLTERIQNVKMRAEINDFAFKQKNKAF